MEQPKRPRGNPNWVSSRARGHSASAWRKTNDCEAKTAPLREKTYWVDWDLIRREQARWERNRGMRRRDLPSGAPMSTGDKAFAVTEKEDIPRGIMEAYEESVA